MLTVRYWYGSSFKIVWLYDYTRRVLMSVKLNAKNLRGRKNEAAVTWIPIQSRSTNPYTECFVRRPRNDWRSSNFLYFRSQNSQYNNSLRKPWFIIGRTKCRIIAMLNEWMLWMCLENCTKIALKTPSKVTFLLRFVIIFYKINVNFFSTKNVISCLSCAFSSLASFLTTGTMLHQHFLVK
jgi:hypothetical protein